MYEIKLSRSRTLLMLGLLFVIGLILRCLYFDRVTFGYDQARDALIALKMWNGDPIKIVGPMTDIQGVTHGPMYWYLISPFYHFSNGSYIPVKIFLIVFNLSGIFILYYVAKKLFHNTFIAIFTCFLFAVSFEATQYAKWLSNPAPAVISSLLTYYSFWLILNRNSKGLLLFFISWAFSVQFEFFFVYQILYLIILLFFFYISDSKFKLNLKIVTIGLFVALVILSTFIVSELKFKFLASTSLLNFVGKEKNLFGNFTDNLMSFINRLGQNVYFNIFGINLFIAGILLVLLIISTLYYIFSEVRYRKQLIFLLFWLFSPIILVSFDKLNAYFILLGILYSTILLFSFFVSIMLTKVKKDKIVLALILVVVVMGNLKLIYSYNKHGEVLFTVQQDILYSDEASIIDWIYKDAQGKDFAINTVTNPLFINTTWAFLFDTYGKQKYKYMPIWTGYPQVEVFGSEVKFSSNAVKVGMPFYLIIEPVTGIPEVYIKASSLYEDKRSTIIETRKFGKFIVEKRLLNSYKSYSRDDLMTIIKNNQL